MAAAPVEFTMVPTVEQLEEKVEQLEDRVAQLEERLLVCVEFELHTDKCTHMRTHAHTHTHAHSVL